MTLISRKVKFKSTCNNVLLQTLGSSSPLDFSLSGQKRTPRRGEQQGWSDSRGTEVTLDRAERRSYRNIEFYDTEGRRILHLRSLQMKSRYCRPQLRGVGGTRIFRGYEPLQTFGKVVLGIVCQSN